MRQRVIEITYDPGFLAGYICNMLVTQRHFPWIAPLPHTPRHPPYPQCNTTNVNMFALVTSWQVFNGLDVLPFAAEVRVVRNHSSQWRSYALSAQLLNGFRNYAHLLE